MNALKDYFLLARGDFYQNLLSEVSSTFMRRQSPCESTINHSCLMQLMLTTKACI